ncbi:hypothetical protein [Burkholderia sp. GbtcB21]|uniref:hypothetical protein n=1 Tax=Burkholderia sp. GbtcB21 TaxID=2824766 RepID=UPI001C303B8E|nr:hypothetical protein [Burkholderia sp. GbtcB21]
MTTNESRSAVRVCEIADIECSRGCGTGACKNETTTENSRADGEYVKLSDVLRSPAMAAEAVAIPNSPAYCLRGLYKPADEYFIDGKPCTPDEYIAWQAGIIEAVTKAKLPDPKYYGGSAEEGDQHDVKCAYVDGWNDCRASILAAPQPPAQADARVGLTDEQRAALETALSLIGLSGDPRVRKMHQVLRALLQGTNHAE